MKIHEYNEMMAYLTRPAMAYGGRIGFANGTKNRPKIAGVDLKKVISDSFEKISNQKGKVSISDIVKDTKYSKPTIYKYLSESQSANLIGQPSPFRDKISKEVNQIIDDVFKNKKPLINASPNKIFEKIYGKKFNIKTDNIGVIKKILEKNPNWSKIREAVTNTSARVGSGNKLFETVKFKDFDKAYAKAMKSRSLTRAGTVEEFILRDLKRHIDQGGTKFSFAKGNSLEKGFKGLKIKDLTKGDIIDFAAIKKDDPRFKEYKKVFNDIKKLKLTPYINPVTKEKTTLLKGLQEATRIDAPLHIQHAKGVATEPLKNLSIATHKANIGAKMVGSVEDVGTLGVRSTIPGGKRVYGPKLSFEDEINRLTKFSDRMIKGAGTRTLKTPTETLTKPMSALSELASRTGAGVDPVLLAKAGYEEAVKGTRAASKVLAPVWDKTKSVGGTTLRGLERSAGPWMAPLVGLYTAITGNPPDPTAIENLFIPSFWNQIMKRYNWQDKSSDPIKRRIINAAKRGLIPTNLMPVISRATGVMLPISVVKTVAEKAEPNILQGKFDPEKADQVFPALIEGYEKKWMGKDESPYMDYSDAMLKMRDPDDLKTMAQRNQMRENQNQGGRVGFGSGSTFDAHTKREAAFKAYKDYKKSYYSSRQRYPILTFREFLPLYAEENFNQGGRVGFDKGSPKSPGRRAFIKGVTALAALPIVGKYFKLGKVLSKAGTYTGPAIQKIKGMPEWFPSLVKKLWNEGEDVTKTVAYKERQIVKRGTLEGGDDVDMIYDMDTGDVSISVTPKKGEYSTKSGAYNKEYELDYKKGQADETTKGKKPPDDFSVSEIEGAADPYAMDVNWEGKVTTVDDAMTDLTELEAFARDKTTKQIHKKKGTKPKDVFPDYDPGDFGRDLD